MQTYDTRRRQDAARTERVTQPGGMKTAAAGAVGSAHAPARRVDLPSAIREKMEDAFGMDLSAVELYESKGVDSIGANAVAQGSRIAFAPGKHDFSGLSGQTLLGHELSHIASQARGESRGRGMLIDSSLEAKADREGAMAAAGETVYAAVGSAAAPIASEGAPMQADWRSKADKTFGLINTGSELEDLFDTEYTYKNDKGETKSKSITGMGKSTKATVNGWKNVYGTVAGLYGTGTSGYDMVQRYSGGDSANGTASLFDATASLVDTGSNLAGAVNNFERGGEDKGINTGTAIAGTASGFLRSLGGLITGFSSWDTESKMAKRKKAYGRNYSNDVGEETDITDAIKQAERNARVDKWSGFTKALSGALKSGGAAWTGFDSSAWGVIGGKLLSAAGNGLDVFNSWNTARMKRKVRKDTLSEEFGDLDSDINLAIGNAQTDKGKEKLTDDEKRAAKTSVLSQFLDDQRLDPAVVRKLRSKKYLKKKDIYEALSSKRAGTLAKVSSRAGGAYAQEAVSEMGVHASSRDAKKKGILGRLM
ncbi:MAG: DUF4157 domain-containing protein [Oscillospiraceae bacterium]|nr:DUF4157 domain-containing protein [Oscillospiraceae bacterium]